MLKAWHSTLFSGESYDRRNCSRSEATPPVIHWWKANISKLCYGDHVIKGKHETSPPNIPSLKVSNILHHSAVVLKLISNTSDDIGCNVLMSPHTTIYNRLVWVLSCICHHTNLQHPPSWFRHPVLHNPTHLLQQRIRTPSRPYYNSRFEPPSIKRINMGPPPPPPFPHLMVCLGTDRVMIWWILPWWESYLSVVLTRCGFLLARG